MSGSTTYPMKCYGFVPTILVQRGLNKPITLLFPLVQNDLIAGFNAKKRGAMPPTIGMDLFRRDEVRNRSIMTSVFGLVWINIALGQHVCDALVAVDTGFIALHGLGMMGGSVWGLAARGHGCIAVAVFALL